LADAPTLPQQLKQHLDALRAAGIDFVPKAGPAPFAKRPAQPSVASAVQDPLAERRKGLKLLADGVQTCAKCLELFSTRTQTVSGVGPMDAAVAFLGDGPDSTDDAEGQPFVGAAGAWLMDLLVRMGLKREEVYLLNATRCRAPKRFPTARECENCREYLVRELELAAPKVICCLGTTAAQAVLQTTAQIAELRGRVHDYAGTPVICTFHPAYVAKYPKTEPDCWADMELVLRTMGREPVPTEPDA